MSSVNRIITRQQPIVSLTSLFSRIYEVERTFREFVLTFKFQQAVKSQLSSSLDEDDKMLTYKSILLVDTKLLTMPACKCNNYTKVVLVHNHGCTYDMGFVSIISCIPVHQGRV